MKISIQNSNVEAKALIDTGADISCMAESLFNSIPENHRPQFEPPQFTHVVGVGKDLLQALGQAKIDIVIDGYIYNQNFHIFKNIHHQLILGDDFLSTNKAVIDRGNKTIELADGVHISTNDHTPNSCLVRTTKHINIPPSSEAIIPIRLPRKFKGETALIEPVKAIKASQPLMVAKIVVRIDKSKTGCRVLNCSDETLHLSPGTVVGIATAVNDDSIGSLDENQLPSVNATTSTPKTDNPLSPAEARRIAQTLKIDLSSPLLTQDMKDKILELIGRNRDVSATNLSELGKTNLHTHTIETGDALPVRQRPYRNYN